MLDIAVLAFAFITIWTYSWSFRGHFRSEEVPKGSRLIQGLVIASALFLAFLVLVQDQPIPFLVAGLVLQAVAYALFWLTIRETKSTGLEAAFTQKDPHALVRTGPYAYVRHPFYTSYILFWGAWCLATASPLAIVPFVGFVATYWKASRDEEAKFAATGMSADYADYMSRTGRFFPRFL